MHFEIHFSRNAMLWKVSHPLMSNSTLVLHWLDIWQNLESSRPSTWCHQEEKSFQASRQLMQAIVRLKAACHRLTPVRLTAAATQVWMHLLWQELLLTVGWKIRFWGFAVTLRCTIRNGCSKQKMCKYTVVSDNEEQREKWQQRKWWHQTAARRPR